MARRRGWRRSRPTTPIGRAVRRIFQVVGTGVLVCGVAWSAISVARSSPDSLPTKSLLPDSKVDMPCLSVSARREMEGESCFHAIQRDLIESRISLDQAIAMLRACDNASPEMKAALAGPTGGYPGRDSYEYTERVRDELFLLAEARQGYLEAAGRSHRWTGSIERFISSVGATTGDDPDRHSVALEVEEHRTAMLGRLESLDGLGVHPALLEMAEAGVETTFVLSDACALEAQRKERLVRMGAGVVTALTGAAAVVVASGAAGSIIGGITIAAALEAAGGAYLSYLTEQGTARRDSIEQVEEHKPPPAPEKEPFTRLDRTGKLAMGAQGEGQGSIRDPREGGEWEEAPGPDEGEGDAFEGDAPATEREPRMDSIPAELPPPPEALLELPPMLDEESFAELERLTLPEAQARLDEFLSLASAPAAERGRAIPAESVDRAAMIEEARAALRLWVEQRELSSGFGSFFVRAELHEAPASRREELHDRVMNRYARDRSIYRESATIEELRQRLAERLVVHCRAGAARGDLMLEACADPTALTLVVVGAMRDAELAVPRGTVLGVQAQGPDFHAVLFDSIAHDVVSLVSGDRVDGVRAPIYHPASFYYGYLAENGVTPAIDPEEHLLIARADGGAAPPPVECEEPSRNFFGKILDWFRSLVGADVPSRRGAACGKLAGGVPGRTAEEPGSERRSGGVSVTLSMPNPAIPIGGGQQGGGGQGGGGGGGGNGGSPAGSPGGKSGSGGGDGNVANGAQNGAKSGDDGVASASPKDTPDHGGGRNGEAAGKGSGKSGSSGGEAGAGAAARRGPDLISVAEETLELAGAARDDATLHVRPWHLRADHSFTPSAGLVLYAANENALARFGPEEQFVTMSPSATEEQRRMFAADSFPIFPAGTGCDAPDLPPRRVFRRATPNDGDSRYVFCDHDESIVAFRSDEQAATYASLGAPDRPLLLTRLSSDRIAQFQQSPKVERLRAFLGDPDLIHNLTVTELDSLVSTANQLLWLQERLEAALLQTMGELEGSGVRSYYYELHRQVAQSPFLLHLVEEVYRFNQRLASDPLRTLAWADALPSDQRQRFFQLYAALGSMMYWPDRWQALHKRYADQSTASPLPVRSDDGPSLDFLQVMSDPTRVQVDWPHERPPIRPSIRDTRMQNGAAPTDEEIAEPTDAEERYRQKVRERRRGGTGGLGDTGEGDGLGPERGHRPLQIIRIRVKPETGNPDRPRFPDDNPTRPGGTEGKRKVQEESASRQEPALWISPEAFVDAILSGWDAPGEPPASAGRVPPVLRFSPRLRDLFLTEMNEGKLYEGRLVHAITVLTSGGWLRFEELRDAMGGTWSGVRAYDTGRYAVEYSTAAAITEQEQVGGPDFFTKTSVAIPADLVAPVRTIFTRDGFGAFDLEVLDPREALALPPADPGSAEAAAARGDLLRALRIISEQKSPG
ncbi:MAG TPA: hypothetical protein VFI91_08565 [Longimicrobiaceae bacterium]|nr:hypothetical protein [Longimicrobiaceae bacterium]